MLNEAIQLILDAANEEDWSTVTALLHVLMHEPGLTHEDRHYAVKTLLDFVGAAAVQDEAVRGTI